MTRSVCTLLLVEDFSPDREQYRRYLRADACYDYCFLEAESVEVGLHLCQTQAIDAILLDYLLPDGDGLGFLEALQRQSCRERPPVVMVTGEGDETIAVQAIKLGAEDYLVKHCLTPEQLQMTMGSAIENAYLRLQVQQRDEQFRVSIENMLDCFGMYSAIRDRAGQIVDFRIDYLNAAALQNNHMTLADMGKGLCELLPAHRHSGLFEQYCQVVETGIPLIKEEMIYSDVFGVKQLTRAYDVQASRLNDGFVAAWRDVTVRKQAELALQESNQRITAVWESMTEAYVTLDREWRIVYANRAATQVIATLTQRPPEECLGKTHWELFPWSVGQIIEQEYRRAVTDRVAVHFEILYEPTANWFEIHAYPSEEGLGVYFRDITEAKRNEVIRKQAEATVQQQLSEIEAIYKTAPIGLCFVDTDLRFVRINEQLAQINGLPVSEHLGRSLREVLPEMADQLESLYRQVIVSGDPILNLEVQGTNGAQPGVERQWLVSYCPHKDANQQVLGVNTMVQEITDRKQSEQALRQSEERYRYLAGLIPQLVWIADPKGLLLDVNERWLEFTGLTLEQVQTQGWQAIVHPEDLPNLTQAWLTAQQQGTSYQAEGRMRRADGLYQWHLHQAMPLQTDQGQILKWFGTATNIHDLKQIQAERAQLLAAAQTARAEAEAANRSKDEFVAMVAHELRSPLNSIAGWAQLLRTGKFDATITTKALDTIYRNTQTQVQLVEDLLDISRLVRGTLQINLTPVNWVEVIEAALDVVRPMAAAKQIDLITQFTPTAQVSGDFARLQQIAVNLLTNAIKFTPEHGRVEVQLGRVQSQVQLQIRDTGKGIAAEFLPRIFDRFQQGQQTLGSKDGLGLGLAIVKNLVELHGGTIVAHSPGVGQGATFTVLLPRLATAGPSSPIDSTLAPVTSLAGVRILAVDDEPDMLDLVTYVLKAAGAQVQPVLTVTAALTCLPQFQPDIVISDIAMPESSGYELIQQMRSLPAGQIPAIALTAYASTTYEERSLQAGFQCHLTKPMDTEVLIATIARLVPARRPS